MYSNDQGASQFYYQPCILIQKYTIKNVEIQHGQNSYISSIKVNEDFSFEEYLLHFSILGRNKDGGYDDFANDDVDSTSYVCSKSDNKAEDEFSENYNPLFNEGMDRD